MVGFCEEISGSWGVPPNGVNAIDFSFGIIEILSMPLIIYWIRTQARQARKLVMMHQDVEAEQAASNTIFPVFVQWLWGVAIANVALGVPQLFIPLELGKNHHRIDQYIFPITWGAHHFVSEGLAVLLIQRGVGIIARKRAIQAGIFAAIVTAGMLWPSWAMDPNSMTIALSVAWEAILAIFYGFIYLAPQHWLFRRPAAIKYGRFWFILRVIHTISRLFIGLGIDAGWCIYDVVNWIWFGLIKNFVIYKILLEDSAWWQGTLNPFVNKRNNASLTDPLLGIDLKLSSAQALASQVDSIGFSGVHPKDHSKGLQLETNSPSLIGKREIKLRKKVSVLNFAFLKLDRKRMLGSGGTSKVYRGQYKEKEVAVKLVFVMDITIPVIRRAVAEVQILSQFQNYANVVKCYGVVVLPPCIAIVLELCQKGSLRDVLMRMEGTKEWKLRCHFCRDCARGLYALHSRGIVHRDLKSMNFLVDDENTVKIADLELVGDGSEEENYHSPEEKIQHIDCLYWTPPEALRGDGYAMPGDIYALAMVFWEVCTGRVPWGNISDPEEIKRTVLAGERPDLPKDTPAMLKALIGGMWHDNLERRLSAKGVVDAMDAVCASLGIELEKQPSENSGYAERNPVGHDMKVRRESREVPSMSMSIQPSELEDLEDARTSCTVSQLDVH